MCFVKIKSNCQIGFALTMESFKHSKGQPHVLYVEGNKEDYTVCPVQALWTYFQVRKPSSGPLFTFMSGTSVSRKYFLEQLCLSLNWCGLDSKQYKGLSFRIGAAITAFTKRISDQKIKGMGRWSSDAFKKYIRVPVL